MNKEIRAALEYLREVGYRPGQDSTDPARAAHDLAYAEERHRIKQACLVLARAGVTLSPIEDPKDGG